MSSAATPPVARLLRVQLGPVMERRGPVVGFPWLQLDTPAATELANLLLQHEVLGALPPALRPTTDTPGAGPTVTGLVPLPAGAESAGTAELTLAEGGPARRWQGRVLVVGFTGEGCGAYCESFARSWAFDTRSGRLLTARELFTPAGLAAVTGLVREASRQRLRQTLAELRRARQAKGLSRDQAETIDAQTALYEDCLASRHGPSGWMTTADDPGAMSIEERQVRFVNDRCSNHAMRAIDELGDIGLDLPIASLRPHLSPYGLALVFGEGAGRPEALHPTAQVFRGRIDGRIPFTMVLRLQADPRHGSGIGGVLYYDRIGSPIRLQVDPVPGQSASLHLIEQTDGGRPGRFSVQLDAARGRLLGDWRQAAGTPLSVEAQALGRP